MDLLASNFSDPQVNLPSSIHCHYFKYQAKYLWGASGVFTTFRELLTVITFLLKSLLIQEYIFCCVSFHKSAFPPIYHSCCFSLNTLQYVSDLLIMRFPDHSASFQAQSLIVQRWTLPLYSWPTVSTYKVLMLSDHIWTHNSCALHYNSWGGTQALP